MAHEFSATPWTATFADEEFGNDDIEDFIGNVERFHDLADAIVFVPNTEAVEEDRGIGTAQVLKSTYLRNVQKLISVASSHNIPVIAYLDEPDSKAEFNLTMSGLTYTVDNVAEPALLPLKIFKAVNANADAGGIINIASFSLDSRNGIVTNNGQEVPLTATERGLFLALARRIGKVRTKESVFSDLYQLSDAEPDIKIVDVMVAKLRQKLNRSQPGFGYDVLRTAWGDGYQMPDDIPANRQYFGLLRLDPQAAGHYQIADTQITLSADEFLVFTHLHQNQGRPEPLNGNFMNAHAEVLEQLEQKLSGYLVSFGSPVEIDHDEGTVHLNMSYFDTEICQATDFHSLLRQDVRAIGPYRFIKLPNGNQFRLQDTDELYSRAAVQLLEHVHKTPHQAIRASHLFSVVRGSTYRTKGLVSPTEDIMQLAKDIYTQLHKSGLSEDEDAQLHFYHDEFLSFGPAEDIPDPAVLEADRKERLARNLKDRLLTANGSTVIPDEVDMGYFTLLVHPTLGSGVVKDQPFQFTVEQVKILTAIMDKRPESISKPELHEAVFPNRPYSPQTIENKVSFTRKILAGIDPEAKRLVYTIRGAGYQSFLPDEIIPEPEKKPARSKAAARTESDAQPGANTGKSGANDNALEEIELRGGLTILKHPQKGTSSVKDTDISLNKNQTALIEYLSEHGSRTIYDSELIRELGVKGIKKLAKDVEDIFLTEIYVSPFETTRSGYRWLSIPHPTPESFQRDEKVFAFRENGGFICHCENHEVDFTVREVELLSILDDRHGQTLDADVIREKAVRFEWPDNVIEQTLTQALGKISNTPTYNRISMQKQRGGNLLLTMH